MNDIKISVVIPVYNVETYLRQCVDSVLHQTLGEIQIILVDDGSTDSSGKMCDEYAAADGRIIVVHKENGGLSSARNAGLRRASGEYVCFLDSDDFLELNTLEELYDRAHKDDLDILLFSGKAFVEGDVSGVKIENYQKYIHHTAEVMTGPECLISGITRNEYVPSACLRLIRMSLLEGGERFSFHEGIIHEDEDFGILTLLAAGRVGKTNAAYYNRRYRPGSIMTQKDQLKSAKGYAFAAEQMLRQIPNESPEVRKILLLMYEVYLRRIGERYHRASGDVRREIGKVGAELAGKAEGYRSQFQRRSSFLAGVCFPLYSASIQMVKWVRKWQRRRDFLRNDPGCPYKLFRIRFGRRPRIFLLGTPVHGNLGDHLIAVSEKDYFTAFFPDMEFIDCTMPFAKRFMNMMKRCVREDDILCISGGGWLGSEWQKNEEFVREIITSFPSNRLVILPQTVYYRDSESDYVRSGAQVYSSHPRLLFCVRERASYDFLLNNGFSAEENTLLMPDFGLLYHRRPSAAPKRENIVEICFRDDLEQIMDPKLRDELIGAAEEKASIRKITTVVGGNISTRDREKAVEEIISEVGRAGLLITDRLHAMVIAAIAGTPCIAFDNSTHKVSGVYHWMSSLDHIRLADPDKGIAGQITELYDPAAKREGLGPVFGEYETALRDRILGI